jgi:hypothetical protein
MQCWPETTARTLRNGKPPQAPPFPSGRQLRHSVYVQPCDGGPASCSQAVELACAFIQGEVLFPLLETRVKEGDRPAGLRVESLYRIAFVHIARPTAQGPVGLMVSTSADARSDMFHFERKVEDSFRRAAVFTTVARAPRYQRVMGVHRPRAALRAAARLPAA